MDIHNYKRAFERQIVLLKECKTISKENKKIALAFKDFLLSEGIGVAKIARYLIEIRKFNELLKKPFSRAKETDIRKVIAIIEQSNLAPETKKGFKRITHNLIAVEEKIHPVYSELLPKLEKEINKQLGLLGLLPQQQIERQKLILIEKLRKRLLNIEKDDKEYSIDAVTERRVNL